MTQPSMPGSAFVAPDGSTTLDPLRAPAPFADPVLRVLARKREARRIDLAGVVYSSFKTPKTLASLDIARASKTAAEDPSAMVDAMLSWVREAFQDEAEAADVIRRLRDKDDDLDIDTIAELLRETMTAATGDPTG